MASTSVPRCSFAAITLLAALVCSLPAQAERIEVAGSTGQPGLSLQAQGSEGVRLHFEMNAYTIDLRRIDGTDYQKVSLPGAFLPNEAGAPDLPGLSRMVAIPQGATVTFTIQGERVRSHADLAVAPAPVIPLETDDGPLVYAEDPAIYGRDSFYPDTPVLVSEPQKLRGVDYVTIGVTPFQYNPVTHELLVYTELDLEISFAGGNGVFGEERLRSRFWDPILREHLINHASLPAVDYGAARGGRDGYEYVIISPTDPAFVAWADTLASWRKLQGISSQVYTTAEVGTTAYEIEAWLNNAYNTWEVPPAAFLILGDYPNSGDNRDTGITAPLWDNYCVSDNIYADVNGDNLPDMAHARITARDAAELERMINKMLTYEREPYTDPGFYSNPVIAGGWQTERWFIFCTEIVLGFQELVLGKTPVREYAIYSGSPGSVWSTNQNTGIVLDYFGPNGLGYIPQTPGHLTDWGGNATRINNDLNAGAFMMLHRDHGYEYGWGEPDYSTTNLPGLNNDLYPFVFSINCLTGKYNYNSETFTEAFHRMEHGALGLIAASEVSYSFVNDTFIWGMFDGLWSEFMPDYGPYQVDSNFRRPAFGMASGKYFLQSSSWPYNSGSKTVTYHLFHHHGDAFLSMYTEMPQALTVSHDPVCYIGLDVFNAQADAGALIGLTVDGEIIGVAEATGAPQAIPIIPQTNPGTLRITITKPDYYRYDEQIPLLPPEGPYLIFSNVIVHDPEGDNDGILDASETVGLELVLENVGVDNTTNVTAEIASTDPYITVISGSISFPDIPAGGTGHCQEPFVIEVSGAAPDEHVAAFTLVASADEGQWEGAFSLPIQAPVIAAGSVLISDPAPGGNADGGADPGERFHVQLWLGNVGHSTAIRLNGVLTSEDPNCTIHDDAGTCPGVEIGGDALIGMFEIEVSPLCPDPSTISCQLALSAENGFSGIVEVPIDIGAWFDDAETDRGWTLGIPEDDATTGQWIRAEPIGTVYNDQQVQPEFDHTPNPAEVCFVTGNGSIGGSAGENDVDGGRTTLLTPVFALGNASTASIEYWRWYTNDLGGSPGLDYWDVEVTADGDIWVPLEHTMVSANSWNHYTFNLDEYVTLTDQVQIRFVAADEGDGSLVEAAVDDFALSAVLGLPGDLTPEEVRASFGILSCGPSPTQAHTTVVYRVGAATAAKLAVYDLNGRMVRQLLNEPVTAGRHSLAFDGRDARGRGLPAGIYFLRLETPEFDQVRQITLLK